MTVVAAEARPCWSRVILISVISRSRAPFAKRLARRSEAIFQASLTEPASVGSEPGGEGLPSRISWACS